MKIDIQDSAKAVMDQFRKYPDQMAFAVSLGVNTTGQEVKAAIKDAMPRVFDRPTPFTLNALQLTPGTKAQPEATVWFRDHRESTKSVARVENYLTPEVYGGARRLKAFEKALQAAGVMPAGTIAVIPNAPSWGIRIDQYGNLAHGLIGQLLSYFGAAQRTAGYTANSTAETRAKRARRGRKDGKLVINGVEYFFSKGAGSTFMSRAKAGGIPVTQELDAGIWARRGVHGRDLAPVILFVKPANYTPRLPFFQIAQSTVEKRLAVNLEAALVKALGTAKR